MDQYTLVEKCKKMIFDISSSLMSVVYMKNMPYSVIRLMFLKYVTDNCFKADNSEKMMDYIRVQKMFAARDNEGGQAAVYPILQMLDKEYNLDNILVSALGEYAKDLFGTDESWGRKNSTMNHHKAVMGAVAELNLEERDDGTNLGRILAECLATMVDIRARDIILVAETATPASISQLSKYILNVSKENIYADFVAGAGLSTLAIVTDRNTKIVTSEINSECAAVSAMLYIMAGYQDISISVENSLVKYENQFAVADKMFIDAPFSMKQMIEDKNMDSTYLSVEKTMNMLKDNGTAIIVVPGSMLFGMKKLQVEQRKKLLDNNWLKAVIALPPCFYSTGIGVNLLIVSKTNNEQVRFIDASTNSVITISEKERRNHILSEEGIATICQIFSNNEEIVGVSKICSISEIAEMNYDLTPARYMTVEESHDGVSLADVENELAELYRKLVL